MESQQSRGGVCWDNDPDRPENPCLCWAVTKLYKGKKSCYATSACEGADIFDEQNQTE